MPISVNLTYRANISQPLTWAQGDANFKTLADNDVFLNSAVEAAALAATNANDNANSRQPSNAKLTAIAASVWAANQMILLTGVNTLTTIPVNPYGLGFLNYDSATSVKVALSLENVNNTSDVNKPISTATQTALDLKISASQRGIPNGVASLGADGKLPPGQLPPLAVNEVFTVASQAEMLALTAERGDVAVRSDQTGLAYILAADNPTVLANWKALDQAMSASLAALNVLTPAADRIPFYTGALTAGLLTISDIGKSIIAAVDKLTGRNAIDAAKLGANSDITSLSALTTALSVGQGGTGKTSVAAFLADLLTAGAYGKTNALGTVSVVSGVPTGALMEQGSNANGRFWKFTNGLMICVGDVGTFLTAGGVSQFTYTMPASFIDGNFFAHAMTQPLTSGDYYGAVYKVVTAANQVQFGFRNGASAQNISGHWVAIGRFL